MSVYLILTIIYATVALAVSGAALGVSIFALLRIGQAIEVKIQPGSYLVVEKKHAP